MTDTLRDLDAEIARARRTQTMDTIAARLARIGHVVVDRVGNLTGVIYMERVTWSDGKEETVTRTVARRDMPAEDVAACEFMLAMRKPDGGA